MHIVDYILDPDDAQGNVTRRNHVMWTMGDDFKYQYAKSWFKQTDKLIHYVKKVIGISFIWHSCKKC